MLVVLGPNQRRLVRLKTNAAAKITIYRKNYQNIIVCTPEVRAHRLKKITNYLQYE